MLFSAKDYQLSSDIKPIEDLLWPQVTNKLQVVFLTGAHATLFLMKHSPNAFVANFKKPPLSIVIVSHSPTSLRTLQDLFFLWLFSFFFVGIS